MERRRAQNQGNVRTTKIKRIQIGEMCKEYSHKKRIESQAVCRRLFRVWK